MTPSEMGRKENVLRIVPPPKLPAELLSAIAQWHGKYSSDPTAIYHSLYIAGGPLVGVFGDGSNGCYEWFIWEGGTLQTSDLSYGSDDAALRGLMRQTEDM